MNILDWCTDNGNPAPKWVEEAGSVVLSFTQAVTDQAAAEAGAGASKDGTPHVTPHVIAVLRACKNAKSRPELQEILGLAAMAFES